MGGIFCQLSVAKSLNSCRRVHFLEDEGIENSEDVFAVVQNAFDCEPIPRVAKRQALPAFQDFRGNVDILPQLLQGITAHKEAIEKRRLVLRLTQIDVSRLKHKIPGPAQSLVQSLLAQEKFFTQLPSHCPYSEPFVKPRLPTTASRRFH